MLSSNASASTIDAFRELMSALKRLIKLNCNVFSLNKSISLRSFTLVTFYINLLQPKNLAEITKNENQCDVPALYQLLCTSHLSITKNSLTVVMLFFCRGKFHLKPISPRPSRTCHSTKESKMSFRVPHLRQLIVDLKVCLKHNLICMAQAHALRATHTTTCHDPPDERCSY
uniref:Secreted protein n=1 Tax=Parascaris univalens TaxID=6257 RepID=A0A914ZHP7_PARUN